MEKKNLTYDAPVAEIVEIEVEQVFAASGDFDGEDSSGREE